MDEPLVAQVVLECFEEFPAMTIIQVGKDVALQPFVVFHRSIFRSDQTRFSHCDANLLSRERPSEIPRG